MLHQKNIVGKIDKNLTNGTQNNIFTLTDFYKTVLI
jgi:hypothetical protein